MATKRSRSRVLQDADGSTTYYVYGVLQSTWIRQANKEVESITDWVTPGFNKLINSGAIINNPLTYNHNDYIETFDGYRMMPTQTGSVYSQMYGATTTHMLENSVTYGGPRILTSNVNTEELDHLARFRALAYVDATPYAFGEDFGELNKTIKYLRNPIKSMVGLAKNFGKARSAKDAASLWLEYRFAFSPLVRSSIDAIDAFNTKPKQLPPRLTARGFVQETFTDSYSSEKSTGTAGNDYATYWSREFDVDYDYHASILYTVSNPIYDRWHQLGLRPRDIPYVAWQLFPYSFMVDRVYDISSFIRSAQALLDPGIKFLAASISKRTETRDNVSFVGQDAKAYTATVTPSNKIVNNFSYTRDPWTPSWSDAIPSFKPSNWVSSMKYILDDLALIINLTRH